MDQMRAVILLDENASSPRKRETADAGSRSFLPSACMGG
jgi:hypothetical protein